MTPICIACHVDNLGSNKVSLKAGFSFVETREAAAARRTCTFCDDLTK